MVPPDSDRVSRVRSYSGTAFGRSRAFAYGTVALCGATFQSLRLAHGFLTPARERSPGAGLPTTPGRQRLRACTCRVWADPLSLATTRGVSVDFLSSRY